MAEFYRKTAEDKEEVKTEETKTQKVEEKVEVAKPRPKPSSVPMIKNYRGGLMVELEPYDFSAPARKIRFKFDKERQYVPIKWAIGVFVTESALRQLELGYFTFEDLGLIIEMAEEEGLYVPDSIKEPKLTSKEMKQLLLEGNVDKIKQKMINATPNKIGDLISIARKLIKRLNYSVIQFLEKEYKVSLETVDLNG